MCVGDAVLVWGHESTSQVRLLSRLLLSHKPALLDDRQRATLVVNGGVYSDSQSSSRSCYDGDMKVAEVDAEYNKIRVFEL